jgi:hypothetical protein
MKIILASIAACLMACQQNTTMPQTTPTKSADALHIDTLQYLILKKQIANNQCQASLFTKVVDSIVPYWYGTPWNFYGTSTTPQHGTIACGYFVTTILRDAGIKLQRVHLAQQAASGIIKTLCKANTIKTFSKFEAVEKYFQSFSNQSLFIIGLDCHVGFVAKENEKLYFIHSSYVQPAVVKKELLKDALPIKASKMWMIGEVKK